MEYTPVEKDILDMMQWLWEKQVLFRMDILLIPEIRLL